MEENSDPRVMTPEQARQWAAAWRRAAPELERVRSQELRRVSTDEALRILAPMFADALKLPPHTISGMVEQQRLFAKVFG